VKKRKTNIIYFNEINNKIPFIITMNSLLQNTPLNTDIIKIIDLYTGITEEKLLEIEKRMLKRYNQKSILLIEDKDFPIALFTSREKAEKYMIQLSIEDMINKNNKYEISMSNEKSEKDDINVLYQDIFFHISNNYQLIDIFHLKVNKPVYVTKYDNGCIIGDPTYYLTNSVKKWKSQQCGWYFDKLKGLSKEYKEACIVDIDPEFEYDMEQF
jgi:hypothetical protein